MTQAGSYHQGDASVESQQAAREDAQARKARPSEKKWSIPHRLWHWANAGLIGFIFLTVTFPQPLWRYHVPAGIALALVFLARAWFFVAEKDRHFLETGLHYTRQAKGLFSSPKRYAKESLHIYHKATVKISYLLLYLVLFAQLALGGAIVVLAKLGFSHGTVHAIKELHEGGATLIGVFAGLHIVGVVVAELTREPGIVSDMINGGQK